ncbi:MAG: hypothetical protein J6S60_07370 [Oscillospiraceae bacterium]|nr:hypothetical protein [Oscillospiraceae bacterium]
MDKLKRIWDAVSPIVIAILVLLVLSNCEKENNEMVYSRGYDDGVEAGREIGYEQGYKEGYSDAETIAWDDGYEAGLKDGKKN